MSHLPTITYRHYEAVCDRCLEVFVCSAATWTDPTEACKCGGTGEVIAEVQSASVHYSPTPTLTIAAGLIAAHTEGR